MHRSMLKLLGAAVLIIAANIQPLYADPPSCHDSAETCASTYSGCPYVGGYPPGVQMFCYSECSETSPMMYSEYCQL